MTQEFKFNNSEENENASEFSQAVNENQKSFVQNTESFEQIIKSSIDFYSQNLEKEILDLLNKKIYSNASKEQFQWVSFKRKKVIKQRVNHYYELFKQSDYTQNIEKLKVVQTKPKQDSDKIDGENMCMKRIRKSALIKRLSSFWTKESPVYPLTFKYILSERHGKSQQFFEICDLTKKQFGSAEEGSALFQFENHSINSN